MQLAIDWNSGERRHRGAGFAAVVVLHALLAAGWLASWHPVPLALPGMATVDDVRRIDLIPEQRWTDTTGCGPEGRCSKSSEWPVHLLLPPVPKVTPIAPETGDAASAPVRDAAPAPAPVTPAQHTAPAGAGDAAPADLLANARGMAGKVDKQLRKESGKPLPALANTPYKQFQADLEAAHVPHWSGIATVTEIAMPGTGERVYKISNGTYSYCITVPNPSMGIDAYEHKRGNVAATNCPR